MRIDILTREYPPNVYGGAGVHVAELTRALRAVDGTQVQVRAFDEPADEPGTTGYAVPEDLADANGALRTLGVDLLMARDVATGGADLVHSHTWYANMGGHLGGALAQIPHVVSAHSLEPLRPWKAEQLGGGYAVSSMVEKVAYEGAAGVIAVSAGMRRDILAAYPGVDPGSVHVVHNGIDADLWQRDTSDDAAEFVRSKGIDPHARSVVFLGRITRQKGLPFLLKALRALDDDVQVVLLAGAPDTEEIKAEVIALVDQLRTERGEQAAPVVWIDDMLPRHQVVAVLSHATVFVCPSVYEPLGIVNLEAMACGAAVVATATGGIPEVVVDGETGWLVPIEQVQDGTGTPVDEDAFVADLGRALVEACSDAEEARRRGEAGRARAVEQFSWTTVAERTVEVYRAVLEGRAPDLPELG
ncbi:glycosyl transferase family 1 [Serinicoccus chungangensis]|uniref:D-inositol 3-phosphate glycosyltransferase n=1 Tax=Serinicoccus chungangensis TaxID=767452 RepID=A0A0W8I6U7_9MICO|nr:glycogen synthase [Serinicoccus chungangensis]KUG54329.1 glycosyl transferase family 1 [Serinicoccus chungangensis]